MLATTSRWQLLLRLIGHAPPASAGLPETAAGNGVLDAVCAGIRLLYYGYRRHLERMRETARKEECCRRDVLRQARRAKRKSLILLGRLLSPAQRQEFRKMRHFHVVGASTGERYRIRVDLIANIDVMRDDGTVKYRLCARPCGDVPVYDVMAAQLLHLQDAAVEQWFLRQANILSTLPEERVYSRSIWLA